MVTNVEKKIVGFDDKLWEHQNHIRIKLEVLNRYDECMKEFKSKIEGNSHKINECQQLVKDYKNDDLFINCKDNYSKLYQELGAQKHMIFAEFMPEIKKTIIDKTMFVKHL